MAFLSSLLKSLADFLFPASERALELETLPPEKLLALLPESRLESPGVTALFDYEHPLVKELVWQIKYTGNRRLASLSGQILHDVIVAELAERVVSEKPEKLLLVPLPVSDKRRFERGWNQAELLCEAIKACDNGRFKYLPRQLVKIRHTESQTKTASKAERLENLRQSMLVQNPASVSGALVVLIDDVTTTGATFAEAKRALKEAGARRVLCFALAH